MEILNGFNGKKAIKICKKKKKMNELNKLWIFLKINFNWIVKKKWNYKLFLF